MYPLTHSSCLTNAGKDECNVLHDGLLVQVENSAASLFVIAPCSQKFGRELLVRVAHYLSNEVKLAYNADLNDAPVTDLLRQANIKTKNHLTIFSDSSWQDCPDTGRSIGAYIIFYPGGPIYYGTHVPGPVAQSSAESEYNAACTAGMDLSHLRILVHELLNEDPDMVPKETPQSVPYQY